MVRMAWLPLFIVVVAAAAACSGEQRQPATPTPPSAPADTPAAGGSPAVPAPTPTAAPAARRLVAAWHVAIELREGQGYNVYEVGTFDSAGRLLHSFRVGGELGYLHASDIVLAGEEVLVRGRSEVAAFALDGSGRRTVASWDDRLVPTKIAVSPDGRMVAFGLEGEVVDPPIPPGFRRKLGGLRVVEVATGRSVAEWDVSDFAGMMDGWPAPVAWHADGRGVAVVGRVYRDGHGGAVGARLDGLLVPYGQEVWSFDRAGRLAAAAGSRRLIPCTGYGTGYGLAAEILALRDLATGAVIGTVRTPGRAAAVVRFSPDGRSALVVTAPITRSDSFDGVCYDVDGETWHVFDITTGALTPVSDPDAVGRGWDGPGWPTYACPGVQRLYRLLDPTDMTFCHDPAPVEWEGHTLFTTTWYRVLGFLEAK